MLSTVRVNDPAQLDATLQSLPVPSGPIFVLFFGTENQATGQSWCPDCVIADPKIRMTIATRPDATLVECPVGDRTQ
jgi:hypothetical protein